MKRAVAALAVLVWMTVLAGVVLAATRTVHVGYNGTYYFEDATVGDGVVEAKTGDRLSFVFDDSGTAGKRHSAVVTELGIDSGPQPKGATWTSAVLTTPGTYRLFCRFHQTADNHWTTLIVTGAALTLPPSPTPKPTIAPTSTPRPTTSPSPSTGTSSASPVASAGASAAATAPGASAPSGSPSEPGAPGESAAIDESSATPGPDGSVEPGPDGSAPGNGSGPGPTTWLRSVQVGMLAALPILAAGWVAFILSKRRRRPPS